MTAENNRAQTCRSIEDRMYYEFHAQIEPVPDKGGAYVRFPYDIRKEFGKGRVKAEITFDGQPYSGSIVNMGGKMKTALFAILSESARIFEKKLESSREIL